MYKVYRVMADTVEEVMSFYNENSMKPLSEFPFIFALKEDDKICGICEYDFSESLDSIFIHKIFISPYARRQKLGDLLIRSVFNYLEANGVYHVFAAFGENQRDDIGKFFLVSTGFTVIEKSDIPDSLKKHSNDVNCLIDLKGFFDKPCSGCIK